MRLLLVLSAITLLSLDITACGGASKRTSLTSESSSNVVTAGGAAPTNDHHETTAAIKTAHRPRDSDDGDNDPNSEDDNPILDYGHTAGTAEKKAVTELIEHYYAAVAIGDGAKACSLIVRRVAEKVAEEYGQPPGPSSLRGKTCTAVMSKLFRLRRRQLAAAIPTLELTGVRIEGGDGLALLRFATTPEPRKIAVSRERSGAWKIKELFDSGMP
jgi:hypothetical protein